MKKLCTIANSGTIAELGGIRGPITRPMEIDTSIITRLVNRGMNVYEVNPYNRSQKIKLTYGNIMTVNFEKVVGKPAAPVTHNPFKLPEGRRTTVVEESSEVKAVAAKKQQKKNEKESNAVAVTSSDF